MPLLVSSQLLSRAIAFVLCLFTLSSLDSLLGAEPPATVLFNRDVRPILSDSCFQCHGPDQKNRKADLRFDQEDTFTTAPAGERLIEPGKPDDSEFFRRLISDDPEVKMPPPSHGRPLTPSQIETIRTWIQQGAQWQKHWALIPPVRPAVPPVTRIEWPRNAIDNFILTKLESQNLTPSPEADRNTLLRRVSLDLTGFPPTPAELQAFEQDTAEGAYERAVDRLLDSSRYGERMAIRWLDAARYADTHGYQTDGPRDMYRWRDWVIDAYNSNLPFDQFTIQQLAGDLLPNPTRDQLIATGFNRNHRANSEGGILDEEYLAEYAADRVETTCTVWLGVTMMCSRCHDHKYDPFSQEDYYRLFAFFNSVPERGKVFKIGNTPPLVRAPTPAQEQKLTELERQIQSHLDLLEKQRPEWQTALKAWCSNLAADAQLDWLPTDGLNFVASFDKPVENLVPPPKHNKPLFEDALKEIPSVVKETTPQYTPGVVGQCLTIDGQGAVNLGDVGNFDFLNRFTYSLWVKFPSDAQGIILARMKDDDALSGLSFVLTPERKLQLNFVSRWLDDALRLETADPLTPDAWHHLVITYDATRSATGVQCIVDGKTLPMKTLLDELLQTFKTNEPVRLGLAHNSIPPFKGEMDEIRAYDKVLSPAEIQILGVPQSITTIARLSEAERTPEQIRKLEDWYLENQASEELKKSWLAVRDLGKQRGLLLATVPTVMTMQETPEPRPTHILIRGQYDAPGAQVTRAVPAQLPPLKEHGAVPNRLDLARWVVDPSNPLTARVAVNRFWQMYFGQGIVKTVDDFGSQGEWPTHPELLDWLATEFVENGWNVKQLQRLIVTSATYRQASQATPETFQKDPENRLLARGPRLRLPAEMIRDRALLASGLLVDQVGGPSVLPYQPAGLWKELNGIFDYQPDTGEKLYRRSLYTYWKRTAPPPFMMTFDTAGRETCFVRESRTNTPIQALNLLNDVTFVEAARTLAQRILKEAPDDTARVTLAFQHALSRSPQPQELSMLLDNVTAQREFFVADPQAAEKLLDVGDSPSDKQFPPQELAAYTMLANLLFNLDEFVTKP